MPNLPWLNRSTQSIARQQALLLGLSRFASAASRRRLLYQHSPPSILDPHNAQRQPAARDCSHTAQPNHAGGTTRAPLDAPAAAGGVGVGLPDTTWDQQQPRRQQQVSGSMWMWEPARLHSAGQARRKAGATNHTYTHTSTTHTDFTQTTAAARSSRRSSTRPPPPTPFAPPRPSRWCRATAG